MSEKRGHQFDRVSELPPLRESPFEQDDHDPMRAEYNAHLWTCMDDLCRPADRQVEENLRMLHGQHWIQWSRMKQRFVNMLDQMDDDEKRWRHMPVLNRLFLWFVLLHARMTENPPVIAWNAGPDRIDQLLAEVCDPVFKHIWNDVGMLEVLDRLTAAMIPSGRAHLKSRIDPMKGDPIPTIAPALLQLLTGEGTPIVGPDGRPIQRELDVPYAPDPDNPNGDYVPAMDLVGEDPESAELRPREGLTPEVMYEGGFEVDVLFPLEVRGEWGQHVPWHRKSYHIQKTLLTPLQFFESFGFEAEPDVRGQEAEHTAILWRVLHGSGLFGSADAKHGEPGKDEGFITVYESWHRPSRRRGMERTHESAGGRLLITTGGGVVVRDGVRPFPLKYTSPIRCFDFVALPGRPAGTSPQEFLNGPIRTRNRLFAQKLQHATLAANPLRVLDRSQGLQEGQVPNIPGAEVLADRSKSQAPPVEYIGVPNLGADVDQAADQLRLEVDQLGSVSGTEATPPTQDTSGELVKELRFNSDRPVGATMKRMVIELGRMAEDWMAMVPSVWDREKIIQLAGDDGISRTVTVYPEMFLEGTVHVQPEIESMLPEGRGERQARAKEFLAMGVWGDPATPQAIMGYLDHARFPHMAKLTRPGGADRATAEQNVGKLLQGVPAADIPVFPWYDFMLHRWVLEQYMKSPEYLKLRPEVQAQFVELWTVLNDAESEAMMVAAEREAATAAEAERSRLARQVSLKPMVEAAQPADRNAAPGRSRSAPARSGAKPAVA